MGKYVEINAFLNKQCVKEKNNQENQKIYWDE